MNDIEEKGHMSERLWYYMQGNQQNGPVPESHLKGLLSAGTLPRDTMVWSDNLAGWMDAAQVQGLLPGGAERQWHYMAANNAQMGPVPEGELKQLLSSGRIGGQTLVWTPGMTGWAPVASLPDLAPATAPTAPAAAVTAAAQPAAAVQPTTAAQPAVGGGASGPITPSEVVLLHASQFAPEGTMLKGGSWTALTDGAKVGYTDLTVALLSAALLANEQAGVVRLRMQPKKAMLGLKTVNVVMVDWLQDGPAWPDGTLEWMAVEGMRSQKPREAADVFTGLLLMDSTYPHILATNIVLANLASRDVILSEEKKKLLIGTTVNYKVTEQTRAVMAACPPGPVQQLLTQCQQGRPDIWQGLVEAGKAAINNRKEYSD
jgi:hypothetical protein